MYEKPFLMESTGWLIFIIPCVLSSSQSLTFKIEPGVEECFYIPTKMGERMDIVFESTKEYSQDSAHLNFYISTASGTRVMSREMADHVADTVEIKSTGDYKACWENINTYYRKKVYFVVTTRNSISNGAMWADVNTELENENEAYETRLREIQMSINSIRSLMGVGHLLQQQLRVFEAADRTLAEADLERVNQWSMIQIMVMLCVGVLQVMMVRSLFDDRHPMKISLFARLLR